MVPPFEHHDISTRHFCQWSSVVPRRRKPLPCAPRAWPELEERLLAVQDLLRRQAQVTRVLTVQSHQAPVPNLNGIFGFPPPEGEIPHPRMCHERATGNAGWAILEALTRKASSSSPDPASGVA
jgi:hypothetical protein